MRVRFVQSGGFVGGVRECELDSAAMPAGEARELESLVRASGIGVSGRFTSPAGRDLRAYDIRVEEEGRAVAVTYDDETLPPEARPLVSFLRRIAAPRGAGDQ